MKGSTYYLPTIHNYISGWLYRVHPDPPLHHPHPPHHIAVQFHGDGDGDDI